MVFPPQQPIIPVNPLWTVNQTRPPWFPPPSFASYPSFPMQYAPAHAAMQPPIIMPMIFVINAAPAPSPPPSVVVNNYNNCNFYGAPPSSEKEESASNEKEESDKIKLDSKKRGNDAMDHTFGIHKAVGDGMMVVKKRKKTSIVTKKRVVRDEVKETPTHLEEETPQKKTKLTDAKVYKNAGFTSSLSMVKANVKRSERIIARSRKWLSAQKGYGPWSLHSVKNVIDNGKTKPLVFQMNRGGTIQFFPGICVQDVVGVGDEMQNIKQFKQYKVRECGNEPRLHALFTSSQQIAKGGSGFQYGRVRVGSNPLETLPVISKLAEKMAFKFGLSNNQWNIGCHLVIYRDGRDSINWHADDTQGEDMVLSLTVDGPDDTRSICFQPANTKALQDLDEQIELFPRPGDAYSMDAGVQHGYVHAMLKTGKAGYESGKRMAIIFRNGLQKHNMEDNGKIVENYKPRTRVQYIFGGMANVLTEGECYSREALMDMGAHLNDRGNIDGNKTDGCPSIIVCFMRRRWDQDHFHFLTYEAGDHSRPLAMLKSYHDHKPIRVFRSSKGNREKGKYFPVSVDPKRTVYRYDGLYYIICARSRDDKDADPSNARVFYMVRAEPSETMSALHLQNPAAREFLPSLDKGTRDFSERPSEDLHESIDPWSIEGFHDWNPHWCGL